jgi:hypothetical protein
LRFQQVANRAIEIPAEAIEMLAPQLMPLVVGQADQDVFGNLGFPSQLPKIQYLIFGHQFMQLADYHLILLYPCRPVFQVR